MPITSTWLAIPKHIQYEDNIHVVHIFCILHTSFFQRYARFHNISLQSYKCSNLRIYTLMLSHGKFSTGLWNHFFRDRIISESTPRTAFICKHSTNRFRKLLSLSYNFTFLSKTTLFREVNVSFSSKLFTLFFPFFL